MKIPNGYRLCDMNNHFEKGRCKLDGCYHLIHSKCTNEYEWCISKENGVIILAKNINGNLYVIEDGHRLFKNYERYIKMKKILEKYGKLPKKIKSKELTINQFLDIKDTIKDIRKRKIENNINYIFNVKKFRKLKINKINNV